MNQYPRIKSRSKNKHVSALRNALLPIFLLAFVFSSKTGTAQTTDTVSLQLKDALNYALTANHDARTAHLDLENSQYKIDEVRAGALPQISGSAGLNYNPILQKSALPGDFFGKPGETMLITFGQKWNANAGVSLSQTLFDNSLFTGLKAARTTSEFYRLNAQLTDEQIIEQVATTYFKVLVQRQQMITLDSTIENTGKIKTILSSLYQNGLAKRIDLDRLTVTYSNLNSQRTQLLNALQLLQNQLKFLMGMPVQTPIVIPDVELSSIHPVAASGELDMDNRTELKLINTQKSLLTFQKEAIRSEYSPSLSLVGSYSYQGLGNQFPIFSSAAKGTNWFSVGVVGLSLRVPIFNGFATRARIRQADIGIRKAEEDIKQTKLALGLDFENAKTQINNSIITLNSQDKNRELAEKVFFDTQNNYNNGLATLTDLLQSETSLTEAQTNYSQALLDYKIAEIQLIKSQGNLKSLLN